MSAPIIPNRSHSYGGRRSREEHWSYLYLSYIHPKMAVSDDGSLKKIMYELF